MQRKGGRGQGRGHAGPDLRSASPTSGKSVANLVKEAVSEQMAELKKFFLDKGNDDGQTKTNQTPVQHKLVKSPSEATAYEPAVRKQLEEGLLFDEIDQTPTAKLDEQVAEYIKRIRVNISDKGETSSKGSSTIEKEKEAMEKEAREAADKAILDAEKFKATLSVPKGKQDAGHFANLNLAAQQEVSKAMAEAREWQQLDDDDMFFHSTCHVDEAVEGKVTKGAFVDLNKLMPKQMLFNDGPGDNSLRLVNVDGHAEFKQGKEFENKITGIRSWDRAFKVYSTIYSRANPHRAPEILQYAAIINNAAQKFAWEDVANYDYIFRHLMGKTPTA